MKDVAFNIILQSNPLDLISLYCVNKVYHKLLNEHFTFKSMNTGATSYKELISNHIVKNYTENPTINKLLYYKHYVVNEWKVNHVTLLHPSHEMENIRRYFTYTGFMNLVFQASEKSNADEYQEWLTHFKNKIDNYVVKKYLWRRK